MNHSTELALSWRDLCATLKISEPVDKTFRELYAAYDEKHRAYHTTEHLWECLQLAASLREEIGAHTALLEMALWFHDGIYDVLSHRNEEKSADWALRCMAAWGRPAREQSYVRSLILATRHSSVPANPDEAWMVDIDLSILGAPTVRYQAYEAQVRQEYRQVPWLLYRQKRKEILEAFLERPTLYTTRVLQERFEEAARANLRWSLEHLKSAKAL